MYLIFKLKGQFFKHFNNPYNYLQAKSKQLKNLPKGKSPNKLTSPGNLGTRISTVLYLNELEGAEDKDLGGSLEIFEQINNNKYFVPQPDSSQVKKIANIEPKAGRLVVFFNQSNSYHAVSKMQYQKKGRHIVYGGFSLQSSIGSAARFRSKGKLPTNYLIYR